ncbi:MAG: hybrid sensor histidine kinase/response regulator [Verrucomicrobiota bacterium]
MNTQTPEPTVSLLLVDDSLANLQVLAGMLKQLRYQVRLAPSGELALRSARHSPPDLILLDINMPDMNGYEVCTQLKADETLKAIPVIFLSALTETLDKVKAFKVGGVDYITKPFQLEEVTTRVKTHLALRDRERRLQASYARLQQLEELRDDLVHMVVHDLRSPLYAMRISGSLLNDLLGTAMTDNKDIQEILEALTGATSRMEDLVNQVLDISRLDSGEMPLCKNYGDLVVIACSAMKSVAPLADKRSLILEHQDPCPVFCDQGIISRVIVNLLSNAIKFTPPDGIMSLEISHRARDVRFAVTDTGPGIPPEFQNKIFEKYNQGEIRRSGVGTGLGLAFCKLAVETHGGRMGVISAPGKGSTFWFTLPGIAPPRRRRACD